jgi:MFS superfamily sulfate permease-like transporter
LPFLGRIPGTDSYCERLPGVVAFRPEASLMYVNADGVLQAVLNRLSSADSSATRLAVCDLSASPHVDLAGSRMLRELHSELAGRGIALRIVGARGRVRDLLRADGISEKVGGLDRVVTLASLLADGAVRPDPPDGAVAGN